MGAWQPATPSAWKKLEANLKSLGVKDKKIQELMATKDKRSLQALVSQMIADNQGKKADLKKNINEAFPGMNF